MTISLKHTTQAYGTDAGTGEIRKTQWNEEHTLSLAAGKVLGRDTSGAGAAQELPISVDTSGNVTLTGSLTAPALILGSSGVITDSTNARTLTAADNGKVIYFTNAYDVALNCAGSLPAGFRVTVIQGGTGYVLTTANGQTLVNREDKFETAGQYAEARLTSPSSGTFILSGDLRVQETLPRFFGLGEEGAWYDPSDMTTLFQDSAGTTPVTAVEQPVGLLLDKSRGLRLGPELVTNGQFDTGIAGWTKVDGATDPISWDSTNKRLIVTNDLAYYAGALQTISGLTVGRTYRVTASFYSNTVGVRAQISGLDGATTPEYAAGAGGTAMFVFVATATAHVLIIQNNVNTLGGVSYWDNISVKELPGNHAKQATSASRPVLSARYNLLTATEDFSAASWTTLNGSITLTSNVAAPDGTNTAFTLSHVSGSGAARVQTFTTISGAAYSSGVWMRRRSGSGNIELLSINGIGGPDTTVTLTSSWTFVSTPTVLTNVVSGSTGYFGISFRGTGGDEVDVWHPDLRVANDGVGLPAYQRVTTSTDYDTVGFPAYLRFDGVDDFLATSAVSWPGEYSAFAGVRSFSTSTQSILDADPGSGSRTPQYLRLYSGFPESIAFSSSGVFADAGSSVTSDTSYVLTANCTATELDVRVNGTSNGTTTVTGTLTAAANALYVGRYNGGATQYFNGRLYSAIVRGAATTTADIEAAETWINGKMKAY